MKKILVLTLTLFCGVLFIISGRAEVLDVKDFTVSGDLETTPEGFLVPKKEKITIEGEISSDRPVLYFRGRVGKDEETGGITIRLKSIAGEDQSVMLRTRALEQDNEIYPDAYLYIGWPRAEGFRWGSGWHFRPNPVFYKKEEWNVRKSEWVTLPSASEHSFLIEFRPIDGKMQVWIEGQLMNEFEMDTPSSVQITMGIGSQLESLSLEPENRTESITLPVKQYARAGSFGRAHLKFDNNADIPASFRDIKESEGISIGDLGSFSEWRRDDLQSYFWRRHASDSLPEQRMFSVPVNVYSHAWLLCAMDPETKGANTFTFRVTRYGSSRGDAMADTLVTVPAGEDGDVENAHRVGVATDEQGRESSLWLIRVPIHNGIIQDLIYEDTRKSNNTGSSRYLDIDLLAPLVNAEASEVFPPLLDMGELKRQWSPTDPKLKTYDIYPGHPPLASGVTVFGIVLEPSAATMRVRATPNVKAFYESDHAEVIAEVQAKKAGDYTIKWNVADVDGKIVEHTEQTLKLEENATEEARLPIKGNRGWFAVQAQLFGADGSTLVNKQTSYVMMAQDTRKAGYESPFYGWWFGNNHGSPIALEQAGPLLQRLGIRRSGLGEDEPESETEKYGFTNSTVEWRNVWMTRYIKGELTLAEAVTEYENHIRKELELWPSIDRIQVLHESGNAGAPFPTELWGQPARNTATIRDINSPEALLAKEGGENVIATGDDIKALEDWKRVWPKRIELITAVAKMVREKFPQLKMQYGNTGNSLAMIGELFRQDFPKELMDTISIEDLGQTIAPESMILGGLHSAWFLRELARKMGHGDIPVTACTEWIGRMTERLGLRTQAEWKVRDTLLGLAYGFDTLSVAGLNDAGDAYYFSIWANGGLTGRWPEMAPKPAYAGIATLTQVLDRAKFKRWIPTGSTVLYAQEFQRDDEWVYTFWTPRGTRITKVEFENSTKRVLTDLYGREKIINEKTVEFQAGTDVHYLTSKDPLKSVQAGDAAFPEDLPPEKVLREISLDSLERVEVFSNPFLETISKRVESLPKYHPGQFEVREVDDPEMGRCLEIELIPNGNIGDLEQEYIALKLKKPIKTRAENAGIWIKGNGSWGRVDILKTQPWGPWATNENLHINWSGKQTLNFDGWNFIRYPYYDWVRGSNLNAVEGVQIAIPRRTLVGTDLQPVENLKVRIKKIILF